MAPVNAPMLVAPKPKVPMLSHVQWEHLAAGVSGGVASTLALHPLDLIKIRFQVNEGQGSSHERPQYRGITHAFRSILRTSGVQGLYQGVTPNVWGAGSAWGLYFLFYNSIKNYMLSTHHSSTLGPTQHMMAAADAGVLTLTLTNPIWVAKTRLCLQYGNTQPGNMVFYKGMLDCILKIYKFEGIRGLYKGYMPGLFGVSHGAIQFMAYEELKKRYNIYRQVPLDSKFSTSEYLLFAALSKIFAASITYPYQVVRSRLQDQHTSYTGALDVIRKTYRKEGGRAFYKGLVPCLLRVTPACCITFVIYEKLVVRLQGGRGNGKPGVNVHQKNINGTKGDQTIVTRR